MSNLLKDSVVYGGAAALSKSVALITFPILARHFSVEEYGVLDFYLVLASLLTTFFVFGQDSAVARFFYDHEDQIAKSKVVSQSLIFQLTGVFLIIPLLLLVSGSIHELFGFLGSDVHLFQIVLAQIPAFVVINFSQNLLKWSFSRNGFIFVSLGVTVSQMLVVVFAVYFLDASIEIILLSNLMVIYLFAVVGIVLVRRWICWPNGFNSIAPLARFALPVGLVGLFSAISPAVERAIISSTLSMTDLGLYAVAVKIAMLALLVSTAFQTAWGPYSYSIHKDSTAISKYNLVLRSFTLIISMLVLVLSLVAEPLVVFLASPKYAEAGGIVFPLIMGVAIQTIGGILELGIALSKKSLLYLYIAPIRLVLVVFCSLVLVPLYGLVGLCYSVLIAQVCKFALGFYLAQWAFTMDWAFNRVVFFLSVFVLSGHFYFYVFDDFFDGSILTGVIYILLYLSLGIGVLFDRTEITRFLGRLFSAITR